jgi:5-formyltetrahydrofolate cyclo-ligase
MLESAAITKQSLRQTLRERVRSIPLDRRSTLSQQASENVVTHSIYHFHKSVLLYMPLQDEVDVSSLRNAFLQQGRRIALPRFLPDQSKYAAFFIGDKPLQPGAFGILEPSPELPVPLNQLDLIIVPGLGFDSRGRRLGRGKGFYDRILAEASGVKCGICFDEQIVEGIPVEPHDARVDFIATPSRWLDCRGSPPDSR